MDSLGEPPPSLPRPGGGSRDWRSAGKPSVRLSVELAPRGPAGGEWPKGGLCPPESPARGRGGQGHSWLGWDTLPKPQQDGAALQVGATELIHLRHGESTVQGPPEGHLPSARSLYKLRRNEEAPGQRLRDGSRTLLGPAGDEVWEQAVLAPPSQAQAQALPCPCPRPCPFPCPVLRGLEGWVGTEGCGKPSRLAVCGEKTSRESSLLI